MPEIEPGRFVLVAEALSPHRAVLATQIQVVLSDALNINLGPTELEQQSQSIVEIFFNFLTSLKRYSPTQLGVQLRYRKLTPAVIFWVNKLMRQFCQAYLEGDLLVTGLEAVADFFAVVLQEYIQVCEALPVLRRERARLIETLNPEETILLQMMAAGLTNQQMARRIGVTRRTVVNYLKLLRHKLATYSRTDTVMRAVELGLISLDEGQPLVG